MVLFLSSGSFGATWYLSPTGSDSTGDGSSGNPWFSPSHARVSQGTISPGDTVVFLNGTYTYNGTSFSLSTGDAGSVGSVVKYQAEDNTHSVTLNFSASNGIRIGQAETDAQYIEVSGFTIVNATYGVRIDSDNVSVHDCYITGAISWPPSQEDVIPGANANGCIVTYSYADNFEIYSNTLDACGYDTSGSGDSSSHGIYVHWGSGSIHDNTIQNQLGCGIQIQTATSDMSVGTIDLYNNLIVDTGAGMRISAENAGTISEINAYNNIISGSTGGSAHSGYALSAINGITLFRYMNNTLYNNWNGVAITQPTDTSSIFENNIIVGATGSDLYSGLSSATLTKGHNLTTAGTEGVSYGVVGSFDLAHFASTDDTSDVFLKLLVTATEAIDQGYDLSAFFTNDYDGTIRSIPMDIGAFEYVSGIATRYYLDADGDGYSTGDYQDAESDPGETWYTAGELTAISGDCDDSDAAINPGETEVCGNGVDEDCDGTAQSCLVTSTAKGALMKGAFYR